jgi:replicative superfamily II helicase
MKTGKTKCLYLAPIKSLCHEKFTQWREKFKKKLQITQLTGDTTEIES